MNRLPQPAYVMSEPHLSGYRVIIGYETLADAQAAQLSLAKPQAREDAQPVADAVEPIERSIAVLKGHIAAIQVAKQDGGSSSLITDCINGLPEIVRWIEGGLFNVEAAFEQYEDTPPAPEAEKMRAAMPDLSSVIAWLDNGCDPKHAVTELTIYKARIDQALATLQQEGR